jgi:hypothetical protein
MDDITKGSGIAPGAFAAVVGQALGKAAQDEMRLAARNAGVQAAPQVQPGAAALGLVDIKVPR